MGNSYLLALRERVVAFVEEGQSHREVDPHFSVFRHVPCNNLVILKRETGSLSLRLQGCFGGSKRASTTRMAALSNAFTLRFLEVSDLYRRIAVA